MLEIFKSTETRVLEKVDVDHKGLLGQYVRPYSRRN